MNADRSMAASLAFHPAWQQKTWGLLPLVAAVAAMDAVRSCLETDVMLKWPNDLLTPDGKVGGILSEADSGGIVIGCGINLWWAQPVAGAAALFNHDPGEGVVLQLAEAWASRMVTHLDAGVADWPRNSYLEASATIGSSVEWEVGAGLAVDLSPDGALVVETDSGRIEVRSGDVHLRR